MSLGVSTVSLATALTEHSTHGPSGFESSRSRQVDPQGVSHCHQCCVFKAGSQRPTDAPVKIELNAWTYYLSSFSNRVLVSSSVSGRILADRFADAAQQRSTLLADGSALSGHRGTVSVKISPIRGTRLTPSNCLKRSLCTRPVLDERRLLDKLTRLNTCTNDHCARSNSASQRTAAGASQWESHKPRRTWRVDANRSTSATAVHHVQVSLFRPKRVSHHNQKVANECVRTCYAAVFSKRRRGRVRSDPPG